MQNKSLFYGRDVVCRTSYFDILHCRDSAADDLKPMVLIGSPTTISIIHHPFKFTCFEEVEDLVDQLDILEDFTTELIVYTSSILIYTISFTVTPL